MVKATTFTTTFTTFMNINYNTVRDFSTLFTRDAIQKHGDIAGLTIVFEEVADSGLDYKNRP